MTVFQKLSPTGGGKSAAQNYGRADQLRGLEAFIMLIAGVGLLLLSFTYHSSTAFVAWMLLMGCSSIAYGLHRYIIYAHIHQAEHRWHCGGTRVAFVPPWLCETGEILVTSMMTLSSLLSLCLAVLSSLNEPGDNKAFWLSLLTNAFLCIRMDIHSPVSSWISRLRGISSRHSSADGRASSHIRPLGLIAYVPDIRNNKRSPSCHPGNE